jgi:hypothetical protein
MVEKMSPLDMFNELVRLGYIVPGEPGDLAMPSAYKYVPSFTTGGTAVVTDQRGDRDAQLERNTQRD